MVLRRSASRRSYHRLRTQCQSQRRSDQSTTTRRPPGPCFPLAPLARLLPRYFHSLWLGGTVSLVTGLVRSTGAVGASEWPYWRRLCCCGKCFACANRNNRTLRLRLPPWQTAQRPPHSGWILPSNQCYAGRFLPRIQHGSMQILGDGVGLYVRFWPGRAECVLCQHTSRRLAVSAGSPPTDAPSHFHQKSRSCCWPPPWMLHCLEILQVACSMCTNSPPVSTLTPAG
mmetsp:Transcript_8604/g.14526  ORF Transcript_8604/g.14526 Transcript_8604/m.14526 type:complete len:228 (+) Transcript_8604:470-1153(+)